MTRTLPVAIRNRPVLDPEFCPAIAWTRAYRDAVAASRRSQPLVLALERPDGTCFVHRTTVLPHEGDAVPLNRTYVERLVKTLLWQKGGNRISVGGSPPIAAMLGEIYGDSGERAFDNAIVGRKMFQAPISVRSVALDEAPEPRSSEMSIGRHLDGCRVGFDLGGSDRKCAAVVDGKVIHSEEVTWDPYFQSDPEYHWQGIHDTIRRAAEKLPRLDAIGGSAAGVYVNNEVLVASLFRGVSDEDFDRHVRRIFHRLQEAWGGVPLVVVNDGEVTALAGSMSMDEASVLGVSMGTSEAAGYVNPDGNITPWLNELAFVPVDYRPDAPADEWSGDIGCGVQYFSQQAVGRLCAPAGIELPREMPLAEKLVEVQRRMAAGDAAARRIYETIGTYFGHSIALYAELYELRNLLILGRVTSGEGGELIIERARAVLADEFPQLAESIRLRTPDEKDKRHGQAIAAASLPEIAKR